MNRLKTIIFTAAFTLASHASASDLTSNCVHADTLADTLASVARERGEDTTVAVQFDVLGSKLSNVKLTGGSTTHQRAVRKALSGLGCSASMSTQTVHFNVKFVSPFDAAAPHDTVAASVASQKAIGTTTAALSR